MQCSSSMGLESLSCAGTLTNKGGLQVTLCIGRIAADSLEVVDSADAGFAVQEVEHLDI